MNEFSPLGGNERYGDRGESQHRHPGVVMLPQGGHTGVKVLFCGFRAETDADDAAGDFFGQL